MLFNLKHNLVNDYQSHPVKTVTGLLGAVLAFNIIGLGTCNIHRSYDNKPSYDMTEYLIHADSHSQSEIHYANAHHSNAFSEQHKQANAVRQAYIEKATKHLDKTGLKHGVTKISYNPSNHRLNVRFSTAHPNKSQKRYAQKLVNAVNNNP